MQGINTDRLQERGGKSDKACIRQPTLKVGGC
jgi:hypothetical protein